MPRLRMETDVVPLSGHVHVEVLQQLGHLADEDIPPPLRLNEVERARKAAAGPPGDRCHSRRISRIAAPAAAAANTTETAPGRRAVRATTSSGAVCAPAAAAAASSALRLRNRRHVDPELLRFHLNVEIECRRRLHTES